MYFGSMNVYEWGSISFMNVCMNVYECLWICVNVSYYDSLQVILKFWFPFSNDFFATIVSVIEFQSQIL